MSSSVLLSQSQTSSTLSLGSLLESSISAPVSDCFHHDVDRVGLTEERSQTPIHTARQEEHHHHRQRMLDWLVAPQAALSTTMDIIRRCPEIGIKVLGRIYRQKIADLDDHRPLPILPSSATFPSIQKDSLYYDFYRESSQTFLLSSIRMKRGKYIVHAFNQAPNERPDQLARNDVAFVEEEETNPLLAPLSTLSMTSPSLSAHLNASTEAILPLPIVSDNQGASPWNGSTNPLSIGALIKSNFLGTVFHIYDIHDWEQLEDKHEKVNLKELAVVIYEPNILGLKGPRRMTVLLPKNDHPNDPGPIPPISLYDLYKSNCLDSLLILRNKEPQWNSETESFVLNFQGRVAMASVKNFQLIHPNEIDYIVMQFGRTGRHVFSLDYQYPLSGLISFSIALTSFDDKLACE